MRIRFGIGVGLLAIWSLGEAFGEITADSSQDAQARPNATERQAQRVRGEAAAAPLPMPAPSR